MKYILNIIQDNPEKILTIKDFKFPGVYQIKSKFTGKCYVGSSINISKRWRTHFRELVKNTHHSKYLNNVYNKYGADDLEFSLLEQCEEEFVLKAEQYYLDTLKPEFNSCVIAGNRTGVKLSDLNKEKLRQIALESHKTGSDFTTAVKVRQLDMDRNLIKEWDNSLQAKIALGINPDITGCCTGKFTVAGGFKWEYADEELRNKYTPKFGRKKRILTGPISKEQSEKRSKTWKAKYAAGYTPGREKKIDQTTMDGVLIKTWDTIVEAKEAFPGSIVDCCRGRRISSSGFRWQYNDEELRNKYPQMQFKTREEWSENMRQGALKTMRREGEHPNSKQIEIINVVTKERTVLKSAKEVSNFTGLPVEMIYRRIKTPLKNPTDYILSYLK